MGWTDPASHVFAPGEIVSAATLNTYVKDNLVDLDRRTTPVPAYAGGPLGGSVSVTYVSLTGGPAVTAVVGAVGKLAVTISAALQNTVQYGVTFMGFALSGANSLAAADDFAINYTAVIANASQQLGATYHLFGLNPGSTTVTTKFRVSTGTGTWASVRVSAQPLGA